MVCGQLADCHTFAEHAVALGDQVANHADEDRVGADGGRSHHLDPQLAAEVGRLGVEVVQHLHVVGDEADRCNHQLAAAASMEISDRVTDVGFQPGLGGRAAPALVDELPVCHAGLFRDEPAGLRQLHAIPASVCHRRGNAVRREEDRDRGTRVLRKTHERPSDVVGHRPDKSGVIEEHADLVDLRRPLTHRCTGGRNVFAVLATAGVAAVGTCDEGNRPFHSGVGHLADRVGKQWMPVAIAPIDRDVWPAAVEFCTQCSEERPVLLVDRALATEMLVVLRHFQHPFPRDVSPAEHVFQKRHHVIRAIGTTKRDQQDGVVGVGHTGTTHTATAHAEMNSVRGHGRSC